MKFFFLGSLAHINLILSSSLMSQCGGDNEQNQYDDLRMLSAFHKYLVIQTWESYESFRTYVRGYYKQSPIDCLNLLDRYRGNWVFKVFFWRALGGPWGFIYPTTITPVNYSKILKWISLEIKSIFLNFNCSDESQVKTQLKIISLMIKLAERTAFELKSLNINDKLIDGLSDTAITWDYLIRNISIDLDNKTINYHSLLRTFNEASILVKTDSSSIGPSLRLSKRYALLWFYLRHIYINHCKVIFDIHHHHKIFIIYFIVELWWRPLGSYNGLYPKQLRLLFEELYENEPQQLVHHHILELLRVHNPWSDSNLLGISGKISNYIELGRLITESSKKYLPSTVWKIRAFAELEAYLFHHGQKVDYLTK